jgi:glycosyltransferase involved in cell wall biosynthesis
VNLPPHFSIVIPAYNREREVRRAIESCLGQSFDLFEIIVVDDASLDRTADVIREYAERGVRCVSRRVNGGEWAARSSGAACARGDWVVALDSDDELLPGALTRMHEHLRTASETIDRVGFLARYTDGRVSPFPLPAQSVMGQRELMRWMETSELLDCIFATRRRVLESAPWPDSRARGILHQLVFSKHFSTSWVLDIVATIHTDASNRMSRFFGTDQQRTRARARDELVETAQLLEGYGAVIAAEMPRTYAFLLRNRTIALTLVGDRGEALRDGFLQLRSHPLSFLGWATVLCALGGAHLVTLAQALKWHWNEMRTKLLCRPYHVRGTHFARLSARFGSPRTSTRV